MPSRVRSPTPANTDTPPCWVATRLIISWMSTVLPTPAPPNRPILPPCTYGVSRSMTLMPVGNTTALGSRVSNAGGLAVDVPALADLDRAPSRGVSSGSPMTFQTWPSVTSPTGTRDAAAGVAHRGAAASGRRWASGRRRGTRLSPICWATSPVTSDVACRRASRVHSTAVLISGSEPRGNSTSTTGPAMATTRPSLSRGRGAGVLGDGHRWSVAPSRGVSVAASVVELVEVLGRRRARREQVVEELVLGCPCRA